MTIDTAVPGPTMDHTDELLVDVAIRIQPVASPPPPVRHGAAAPAPAAGSPGAHAGAGVTGK